MYVIQAIPLQRGITIESLSYFSNQDIPFGTIIEIPVRNRTLTAIVEKCESVSAAKTAIRAATFSLKKLPEQDIKHTLASGLLTTTKILSTQYPATIGAILFSLIPSEIRNGSIAFPQVHTEHTRNNEDTYQPEVVMAPQAERHSTYRGIIRNSFARGGSVLIVVPTQASADHLKEVVGHGIQERVIVADTSTRKRTESFYEAYQNCSTTKVFIVTAAHALLDRHDITTVIIEGARSPHYKQRTRPYLDLRDVLFTYTKATNRKLILGDILLRSEDELLLRAGVLQPHYEHPKRHLFDSALTKLRFKKNNEEKHSILHLRLVEAIDETLSKRHNSFLYCPRKGLAPVVQCADCGFLFRCPDSGAPYSLHRTVKNGEEERWFVSGASGSKIRAADVCPECNSWKLRESGIGIQQIYDEAKQLFDAPVLIFDTESANTKKKAMQTLKTFYETKGAVLLGTAATLAYLHKPVALSAVTSLDAMRANPTWRSQEDLFALLLHLRELTTDTVYVQTRSDDDDILSYARQGLVERFYNDELELRKILLYPPFTRFIHLTWKAQPAEGAAFAKKLEAQFAGHTIDTYAAPEIDSQKPRLHYALLRIAESDWPDSKLLARLRALPPSIRIVLNPDRIV